jgi:predicted DNA-binding transcriptional regulator AlpA
MQNPAPRQSWRPPGPLLVEHTARADQLPLADMLAFSIPEFCRWHGISRAHFYNLSKSGDGPAVMRVGRRTLISAEAAAEWRRRMERIASDALAGADR